MKILLQENDLRFPVAKRQFAKIREIRRCNLTLR